MCQSRVSNESVLKECFRVLRESVYQSVPQECRARVSHKSVPQECPARVCHRSVTKECPTRLSEKSVKQECSARVAFNAIEHLLFAFHCSVGTLLLRELFKNAFGFVASIRLLLPCSPWLGFQAQIKGNMFHGELRLNARTMV